MSRQRDFTAVRFFKSTHISKLTNLKPLKSKLRRWMNNLIDVKLFPSSNIHENSMKICPCNKKKEPRRWNIRDGLEQPPSKKRSERRIPMAPSPFVPASSGTKKHVRKLPRKLGNAELEYVWKIREWRLYRHRSAVRPLIIRMWSEPPCDLHTTIRPRGLALGVYLKHFRRVALIKRDSMFVYVSLPFDRSPATQTSLSEFT